MFALLAAIPVLSPTATRQLPAWSLQRVLRIGSADDSIRGFSRINGLAVDADGAIYVAEAFDAVVKVFGLVRVQRCSGRVRAERRARGTDVQVYGDGKVYGETRV